MKNMTEVRAKEIEKKVADLKKFFKKEGLTSCVAFMETAQEFMEDGKKHGFYLRACKDIEEALIRNDMMYAI